MRIHIVVAVSGIYYIQDHYEIAQTIRFRCKFKIEVQFSGRGKDKI